MILEFQLDALDYDAFHANYYKTQPQARRARQIGRWAVPAIGVIVLLRQLLRAGYDPIWSPVLMGYMVSWVFAFPKLMAWRTSRANKMMQRRDPEAAVFQPQRFELGEQGLEVQVGGSSSRLEWAAIRQVTEAPAHLFLYLNERQALILPRRACDSDSDFEALAAFCRERVQVAPEASSQEDSIR